MRFEGIHRVARSEASEQMEVVLRLKQKRILFCAIPNDSSDMRDPRLRAQRMKMGVLAGAPDLLIFDAPPPYLGIALEMKRANGTFKDLRENQEAVLDSLVERGWAKVVGFGAQDAFTKLRAIGLDV